MRTDDTDKMKTEIQKLMASLSERLCERKALKSLFRFLGAYFAINGLTDGWEDCLTALKDLRALCRDDLKPDELDDVNKLINLIHRMLDSR